MNEKPALPRDQAEIVLGRAAVILWPSLPRDIQERLFDVAVGEEPYQKELLAKFLHDHHPRTGPD